MVRSRVRFYGKPFWCRMIKTNLKYDILAVDVDGTLLDRKGRVSARNRDALQRAVEVGLEVVLCTGRSLAEARAIVDEVGLAGAGIFVGGAITVDLSNGQTVRRMNMDVEVVRPIADYLNGETRHLVLLLKDRSEVGVDYRLVGTGEVDVASQWWFAHMPVAVDFCERVEDDPNPHETVRISIVTTAGEMRELRNGVIERFGEVTFTHDFPVTTEDGNGRHLGDEAIHLMEVFRADTNKWTALEALATSRGVATERVVAIGDEINDLGMIRGAGLGVAMGNAVVEVREVADRATACNDENGVAEAVDRILASVW